MVSYEILGPHFSGSSTNHVKVDIAPKDLKGPRSQQQYSLSNTSHTYGPLNMHIVDGKVLNVTSGNRFWTDLSDFGKYGFFSQVDDGVNRGNVSFSSMDNWIANGTMEKPNLPKNQPIPNFYDLTGGKVGGIEYIEGGKQFRLWTPHEGDTKVHLYTTPRLVEATDINSIGKRTSQVENFRQKLHSDLLFNDRNELHYEITQWAEFLDSEGVHPTKNPVLGIGVQKGNYVASHYPELNYLVANTDFNEIAKRMTSRYGLTDSEAVSAMERSVIMHELAHAYGVGGSRRGEQRQGRLQAKFYSKLAKEFAGTKFEKIYKALAREGEDYAQGYSLINRLMQDNEHNGPPWHLMEHKFYHEAEALGLEGKAMEEHIKSRVKDTLGPLYEDEESNEAESRTANRSNVVNLEGIVESASGEAQGKSGSNYTRTNATAKVLKFSDRKSKGNISERNSKTYARSSARETYERGDHSEYEGDSRTAEAGGKETSDAKTPGKENSNSEGGAESQASEKAA
ncbi:MAG TPA: hypothetical protein VJI52_00345 [Candidatus Nanoarchaeia archaeon]|nr:hypothetical protein [Candidatus Nanoarchaeia archaeon]